MMNLNAKLNKIESIERAVVLTHTDLDGVSCSIIARVAEKMDLIAPVSYSFCAIPVADEIVAETIASIEAGTQVFITDIPVVSEATAEKIEAAVIGGSSIELLDHHATDTWLNKYNWASVVPENELGYKLSGTELLFHRLFDGVEELPKNLHKFVKMVTSRDTWNWKELGDVWPTRLNNLMFMYPDAWTFCEEMAERLFNNQPIFTPGEIELLLQEEEDVRNYIETKSKEVVVKTKSFDGVEYTYGAVNVYDMANGSELASAIYTEMPALDFVALLVETTEAVALRAGNHNSVDVSVLARMFGGGGHPKAAGCKPEPGTF